MTILMAHLIGDYILQTDWMGQRKGQSWLICAIHCLLYSVAVAVCTMSLDWRILVVFIQHLAFDKNRIITKTLLADWHFKWASDRERMWLMFLYDNITHLFTLWILYEVIPSH